MNVLLTGATGFLGSHIARALLQRGDAVSAYRRQSSSLERLRDVVDQIRWFDLDADEVDRPFEQGDRVDAVIHAATCYGRAGETIATLIDTNIRFPVALFEQAQIHGVASFLNLHTSLPRELNSYALSKHQLIDWLRLAAGKTKVLHLALEHFYGPGEDDSKFIAWLLHQLLSGVDRIPLTKGEQCRDFLFIDDAVAACLACLDSADQFDSHTVIPVGSGAPVVIRDLVETCRDAAAVTTVLDFGALPYRTGEVMRSTADTSRLRALGWQPQVPLRVGIDAVVRHLRDTSDVTRDTR